MLASEIDFSSAFHAISALWNAEAISHGHLTAGQAARVAKDSGAKLLVLTHFSQRYPRVQDFLAEAKEIHENSIAVRDGDFVDFPKRK